MARFKVQVTERARGVRGATASGGGSASDITTGAGSNEGSLTKQRRNPRKQEKGLSPLSGR